MTPKLIASDLDGTLLDADSSVTARTEAALLAAAKAGVEVVVATGRSHRSALRVLGDIVVGDGAAIRWLICSNGATVYDIERGDVVLTRPLAAADAEAAVDGIGAAFPTAGFAWESLGGVFHTDQWLVSRKATDPTFEARFSSRAERDLRPLDLQTEEVLKLMVAHDELTEYDWLDAVTPHVPMSLSASTSGAAFVEVTAPEANKGDALRVLCGQLGVAQAETVAFGDHANDITMLAWAGTGYAMAGAVARAREAADAVAPANTADGVAQVLVELLGIGP